MGLTYVRIRLARSRRSAAREFRVLVDTGATYTMLPGRALEALGVVPEDRVLVRLGDGRVMERSLGAAFVRYGRHVAWTQVLFGEHGDASVVGALTLEELRLQVDPHTRRLREIKVALLVPLPAASSARDLEGEPSAETKREVERARREIKAGKGRTHGQLRAEMGFGRIPRGHLADSAARRLK